MGPGCLFKIWLIYERDCILYELGNEYLSLHKDLGWGLVKNPFLIQEGGKGGPV